MVPLCCASMCATDITGVMISLRSRIKIHVQSMLLLNLLLSFLIGTVLLGGEREQEGTKTFSVH